MTPPPSPSRSAVTSAPARAPERPPFGFERVSPDDRPEEDDGTTGEVLMDQPMPEVIEPPRAPSDYGALALVVPAPAEEDLVMHSVAGYEVVAVYAEPRIDAAKLGYLRLGTRLKVTSTVGTEGCSGGWHGLPMGGFACASKGLLVDAKRPPYFHRPPPPAQIEESLPYKYAYVSKWNSPMWWRIPTTAEQAEADGQRVQREMQRQGGQVEPTARSAPPTAEEPHSDRSPDRPLPSLASPPSTVDSSALASASAESPTVDPESNEEEVEPIDLPLSPRTPWLEKGFFISLADKITEDGMSWWHTSRGAYVDAKAAYEYSTKDFEGVELSEESGFPFGYAMVKEAKVYELSDESKLVVTDRFERRTFVDLTDEIDIGASTYMMTIDGRLLRKKDLRLAEPQPRPEGIEAWERWIDISLSKQMLVAYEGHRPVYVTLVSTGRKGTAEESFETPVGRYRIQAKHVSSTMDDTAPDGNYSIQDVPWAMFFEGSYALHGAFWHNGFGRPRSHGCVNLGPSAAHWLFSWTTPFVPEGWHGVRAHEGSPGTTVIVRA